MKGINLGEKNNMWKGDNVGRAAIHTWLKRHYGKPNTCEKCGLIGSRNIDWAKIKGRKYERKRENFWRLCHKCHMAYDEVKGIRFPKGHIPWSNGKKFSYKPHPWLLGHIPWNKGLLGFRKGHPNYNLKPNKTSFKKGLHYSLKTEFKKGIIPTNKGKKFVNGHYI